MKIAYFTDSYLPKIDGVVTSVDSFAKELINLGHETIIFCPKQERVAPAVEGPAKQGRLPSTFVESAGQVPPVPENEPKTVHFNSFSYYFQPEVKLSVPTPLISLRQALQPFDIIHSHSPGPLGILAEEIALLRGTPHIHTFHTLLSEYNHYLFQGKLLTPEAIKRLSAFWCNRVDFIVAPSFKVKQELLAEGVARPIEVIPTGINLDLFSPKHSKFANLPKNFLIEKGLVKQGEFVFLSVGRLGREKSIDLILRAFADLVQKIVSTRRECLRLLMVGDGPERENLMDLSRKLGLTAYVSFAGYIEPEEMPKVYREANCFLFASRTETQGLVILEAMAAGLPVIAINDLATAEIVQNEKNGFLVENAQEMATKMAILFSPNSLNSQMSQNSLKIAQNFSIEQMTKKMLQFYEKCQISYSVKSRRQHLRNQYQRLKDKFARLTNF